MFEALPIDARILDTTLSAGDPCARIGGTTTITTIATTTIRGMAAG